MMKTTNTPSIAEHLTRNTIQKAPATKNQTLLSLSMGMAFAMCALVQTAHAEYAAFQMLVPVQIATHTAQLTADATDLTTSSTTKSTTGTPLTSARVAMPTAVLPTAAPTDNTTANISINNEVIHDGAIDDTDANINANASANVSTTISPTSEATDDFDDTFAIDDSPIDNEATPTNDPLEGYNRFMFGVNMSVDKHLIRPVASTYQRYTPNFVQKGVGNFFHNLTEPWTSVNLLLQGRPLSSLQSFTRFGVNTVTTLGFADPAASVFELNRKDEDFGQTLATWGVPAGPYVVLPFFGPSTLRDTGTRFVDAYGSPISYVENTPTQLGLTGTYGISKRAKLLQFEGIIEPSYEVVRDAYLQKRAFDINNGSTDAKNAETQASEGGFDEGFGDE